MANSELFRIISQDTPNMQGHFFYMLSAIVDSIRNCMFMLSNNEDMYLPADIRSVLYYSKKQFNLISDYFDNEMKDYLMHNKEEDTIALIIKQMTNAGEIIRLSKGKFILSPYRLIDIGISNKLVLQGGVTDPMWFMDRGFCFNGTSRIVNKDNHNNKAFSRVYDLNGWLQVPYQNGGLVKWLQENLLSLEFIRTDFDAQMEVFDTISYENLHLKKWIRLNELLKKNAYKYTLGRTKGIDGYTFWVLKNVGSGRYEELALLEKNLVLRFLFGLEALCGRSTKAFFNSGNDFVYLHLPNGLPNEEMRIINTLAYPWPYIGKKVYKWAISKDVWLIIKEILLQLNIEVKSSYNVNVN